MTILQDNKNSIFHEVMLTGINYAGFFPGSALYQIFWQW